MSKINYNQIRIGGVDTRRVINLLAMILTVTLMFITQNTSEYMFILYILILYLGNSFLMSNKSNNDLVPLLTCTELFYLFDFYLFVNHSAVANVFAYLAVIFSFLLIICILKERRNNLPTVTIKREIKKQKLMLSVSLACLLIAFLFNVILLSLINYHNINYIYPLTMLLMTLCMTTVIIYTGYIDRDKKTKHKKKQRLILSVVTGHTNVFNQDEDAKQKFKGPVISNRPYFILSLFYLLFLPQTLHISSNLLRILYIIFFIYILIIMYYPLVKCEYYGFRNNDSSYRLSFKEHFKKSFVYNTIFLLSGLTLSFSLYYVYNGPIRLLENGEIPISKHDEGLMFTDGEINEIEESIRDDFDKVIYVGFEENDNEFKNEAGEKYKRLYVYAYADDSIDVYLYVYYKYTTKTRLHDLGAIENVSSYISPSLTKDNLDSLNIDFR